MSYRIEDRIPSHIAENVDLSVVNSRGEHILYGPVLQNNLNFVKYVLDERKVKIDINHRNIDGETLVAKIVNSKSTTSSSHLLDYLVTSKGADVNIADNNGFTPLHHAWSKEACLFLITHDASINQKNNTGNTPLHTAVSNVLARNQAFEKIQYLLEYGADVNSRNDNGQTPLFLATITCCSEGKDIQLRVCEFLIRQGADINLGDEFGNTPLHFTIVSDFTEYGRPFGPPNYELCSHFLTRGAEVNKANDHCMETALHWVCKYGYSTRICDILLKHGADINKRNRNGETPLHLSVKEGDIAMVNFLKKKQNREGA